jgi:hypothetical protein
MSAEGAAQGRFERLKIKPPALPEVTDSPEILRPRNRFDAAPRQM